MGKIAKTVFFSLALAFLVMTGRAAADQIVATPCQEDAYTQSTIFKVPEGDYNVFVVADTGTDAVSVHVNQAGDFTPNHCQTIADSVQLSPTRNMAGTISIKGTARAYWYVKSTEKLSSSLSANRVRLILVPQNTSFCLEKICKLNETHSYSYLPVSSNAATGRLVISYYVDPTKDTAVGVQYYADDNFIYSKPTLVPFPDQYRALGKYTSLTTLTNYASGQTYVQTETLDKYGSDVSLAWFYQLYIYPYMTLIKIIGSFLIVSGLLYLVLWLYRRRISKHQWDVGHGLARDASREVNLAKMQRQIELLNYWLDVKKPLTALSVMLVMMLMLNAYVIEIFTVSGHSMDHTLKTGQKVAIFKLPVTAKKVIGGTYLPRRGDIIVAKVNQSEGSYTSTFGKGKKSMIKRVVALPGDRVVVQDDIITVYEKNGGQARQFDAGEPWSKTMIHTKDVYDIDRVLKINEVFVAGDNRGASIDSRINGPITNDEIIGVLAHKF